MITIFTNCAHMRFGAKVADLCGWCNSKFVGKCSLCGSKICEVHGTRRAVGGIHCPSCPMWGDRPVLKRINFDGC